MFNCPGYHIVAGRKVHCWKNGGHGTITFVQGIMVPATPTFMMVGKRWALRLSTNTLKTSA